VNSAKSRMIPDHNENNTIFQEVKVTAETFTTLVVHDGKE
jgi:hypothetical protein